MKDAPSVLSPRVARGPELTAPNGPLTGPSARVVLAVLQQALLTPLGTERILVGVKGFDGRFTVLSTDASNLPEPGRPRFLWSHAAPIIASLRQQRPGVPGSVIECGNRLLYRYAQVVPQTRQQVVVGAVLKQVPTEIAALHAAISSALYTLLPQSGRDIPDASVSVSVQSDDPGYKATVAFAGDTGVVKVTSRARTVAMATAQATIEASGVPLRLRFADQIAVAGTPISLIVADSTAGAVVGSSELATPGNVTPALAVLKAANAVSRIEAETAGEPARRVTTVA